MHSMMMVACSSTSVLFEWHARALRVSPPVSFLMHERRSDSLKPSSGSLKTSQRFRCRFAAAVLVLGRTKRTSRRHPRISAYSICSGRLDQVEQELWPLDVDHSRRGLRLHHCGLFQYGAGPWAFGTQVNIAACWPWLAVPMQERAGLPRARRRAVPVLADVAFPCRFGLGGGAGLHSRDACLRI